MQQNALIIHFFQMLSSIHSIDLVKNGAKYSIAHNKAKVFLKKAGLNNATMFKLKTKMARNLIGKCKYCDPQWSVISNFAESAKGYDVPNGNPNQGDLINTIL